MVIEEERAERATRQAERTEEETEGRREERPGSVAAASRPGAFGPEAGVCAQDGGERIVRTVVLVGEGRVRVRLFRLLRGELLPINNPE